MKTLRAPAARTALQMALTLGTMSRAIGNSTVAPGSMKPFCRSTIMCAVRAGSIFSNMCKPPRCSLTRSSTSADISILCMNSSICCARSERSLLRQRACRHRSRENRSLRGDKAAERRRLFERIRRHLAHDHSLLDQQDPVRQTANEIETLFDHHDREPLMPVQPDQNLKNLFDD